MRRRPRPKPKNKQPEAALSHPELFPTLPHTDRKLALPFLQHKLPRQLKTQNGIKMAASDSKRVDTVTLGNGLEVMLVQDMKATSAAVALSVDVGNFSDPEEMEGLAHLSEHMVFLGEKKDENGNLLSGRFDEFVAKLGGLRNAFTATQETNFHYSFPFPKGFDMLERSLDLFSNSFVNPHFSEEGIENESKVVDNEYSKNVGHPFRSLYELLRSTTSPDHPFQKFSCGNFHSLNTIPKEKNLNVAKLLNKFFETHYSSERMKAVIYANISVVKLKSLAEKYFSRIGRHEQNNKLILKNSAFTSKENGRIFQVVSNHDKCELNLIFPLQTQQKFDFVRDLPAVFLSHVLSSSQEGSLVDLLEQNEWGTSVSGQIMPAYEGLTLFWISVTCTEKAIWDNVNEIVHAVFHYISLIYKKRLGKELLDHVCEEFNKGWIQNEDIRAAGSAFEFVSSQVTKMHQTTKEHYFTHGNLVEAFNEDKFLSLLECIVPENLSLFVHHTGAEASADLVEERYKGKYSVDRLDADLIKSWGKRRDFFNEDGDKFTFKLPEPEKRRDPQGIKVFIPDQPKLQPGIKQLEYIPKNLANRVSVKLAAFPYQFFVYTNKPKEGDFTEKAPVPDDDDKTVIIVADKAAEKAVAVIAPPTVNPQFGKAGGLNGASNIVNLNTIDKRLVDLQNKEGRNDLVMLKEMQLEEPSVSPIGKLFTLNTARIIPTPSADQSRPPVLLKATNRSLLFYKQSFFYNYPDEQFRTYVTFIIHLPFMYDLSATSHARNSLLLSFYMDFLNSAMRKYKKKKQLDQNVHISIYRSNGIAIQFFGYAVDLERTAEEIIHEMKRVTSTHTVFKSSRFERMKSSRLRGFKNLKKKPLNIVDDLLSSMCFEPASHYLEREKVLKQLKLRDVQMFANPASLFANRNTQCLVFGNCDSDFALTLHKALERSLNSFNNTFIDPKLSFFPKPNVINLVSGTEQMHIVDSTDPLETDSAYHCDMQINFKDFEDEYKTRATVAILGALIDTPCHDFIRTKHTVGYLIHTRNTYGGLTGGIEFMFQSNKFSPLEMDEKFELFITDFQTTLAGLDPKEVLAAKMSIAEKKFKPKQVVSSEMDGWVGRISQCNYDFDRTHKIVHQMFQVTHEDLMAFYAAHFMRGEKSERKKLLVGLTSIPHLEQEKKKKEEMMASGYLKGVTTIEDIYSFRLDQELQTLP